ncbi:MAG: hypothetical protein IJF20_03965 [Clostridia bacterium]|nr:hypothetical protein [Clostridia bacterium]
MEKKDKKHLKIFGGFLFALKIIFGIFIAVIIILVIDFFVSDDGWHTVVTEIHEGCYIEDLDDNMQSIYYYPDGDETGERKYIVEEWEDIIKHASNGKDIVAFHCIYNKFEDDEEDRFVIFNTKTEEEISFNTQEKFLEFCAEEKIVLSDWYTDGARIYEKIDLGNGWCVYDYEAEPDKIIKGYGVVYEGYIMDLEEAGDDIVSFVFAVPYYKEYEIPVSNKDLEISDGVVGEYRIPPSWFKEEVCYYEKLSLNTKTGEISVIGE